MNDKALTTRELPYSNRRTHGMCRSPEYVSWCKMIARCTNRNENNYERYGGAGITVCREWRESFETFLKDMGKRPTKDHSIERMNRQLGYCKDNCKWATRVEQGANKRNNIVVEFRGQSKTLSEWSREVGIACGTIRSRIIRDKWAVAKALTQPARPLRHA